MPKEAAIMVALIGAGGALFAATITGLFGLIPDKSTEVPPSMARAEHKVEATTDRAPAETIDAGITVSGDAAVSANAETGGVAIVGGVGHTVTVQPEPERVPRPRLTDIFVGPHEVERKIGSPTLVKKYPASVVIDFKVDNNTGTAATTITRIRFRRISFSKHTPGSLGGDEVITKSAEYQLDLADLSRDGSTVEVNVAHQISPGEADRFVVIAADSRRFDKPAREEWTWQLGVTLVTSEGDLSERVITVRLPQ